MSYGWRYKRFHISYLLAWASFGLLAGLFLGQYILLPLLWPILTIVLFVLGVSLKSRRWYAVLICVAAGLILGLMRGSTYFQAVERLETFIGKDITMTAIITQDPVLTNGSNNWAVQLSGSRISEKPYVGEVYATILSDESLKRGDEVRLTGKAKEGFGNFRITVFRARIAQLSRRRDVFLAARDNFAVATKQVMPEPEASLGLGFLVGQKASLPPDLVEQLKTVGLTHIVVASGYNLTILVRFARRLLSRRSRYLALAGSLLLVVGFVLVSGFSPSMNRAAVVTILTLLAWYYGRKFHPILLILYVAATSALLYPSYVWGDLGWLLSFAAFTGVLVMAPLLSKLIFAKGTEPGAFLRLIIETVSAEIMTLPIIIASFGYIPVLALLANVLVAPVIPFAMLLTFIAGLVGLVIPWLALLAWPASIVIAYVVAIVENLASPPWARFAVEVPLGWLVAWYIVLLGVGVYIWRRRRVDLLEVSVVE